MSLIPTLRSPGRATERAVWHRLILALGHLAIAIALTWPLAMRLDRLALGTESSTTVPAFNAWTLAWTADRVPHLLDGWWDAPIFWPTDGAFARSETQLPTGVIAWLFDIVVGDPIVSYGLTLLIVMALNGIVVAWLATQLGAAQSIAWCVGVLAQASPYVAHELGVIQLVGLWPFAGTLAFVLRWAARPSGPNALGTGVFAALTALSCGYYGAYLIVPFATLPIVLARDWPPLRQVVRDAAIAGATAVALAGPVLLGQAQRTSGLGWNRSTVVASSASWSDWLPSGPWWPGWVVVVFSAAGLWIGRRQPAIRWLAAIAVVCVVGSIGARLSILGWRPWWSIADRIPGFDRMRSPFRFAGIAHLVLAAMTAPALGALWAVRRSAAVAAALVATALFPSAGRLAPGRTPSTATTFLASTADRAPVVALPFASSGRTSSFEATTDEMLDGLEHGHPLVNGYTGFFPDSDRDLRRTLRGFPDGDSVGALCDRGVRWAVVDRTWLVEQRRSRLAAFDISVVFDGEESLVIQLPVAPCT